jgi:plasmid stabilization system protein ParE
MTEQTRAWAEKEASRQGFTSVEDYLDSLILREQESGDWVDSVLDGCGTMDEEARAAARQRVRQHVVKMLDEATRDGPAEPMTERDWEEIRRQLEIRRQARSDDVRVWRIKRFRTYLIFYGPLADGVEILRVLGASRDLPALFAGEW